MKFAILALFGLVAVQAVELPTSDELVELPFVNGKALMRP